MTLTSIGPRMPSYTFVFDVGSQHLWMWEGSVERLGPDAGSLLTSDNNPCGSRKEHIGLATLALGCLTVALVLSVAHLSKWLVTVSWTGDTEAVEASLFSRSFWPR